MLQAVFGDRLCICQNVEMLPENDTFRGFVSVGARCKSEAREVLSSVFCGTVRLKLLGYSMLG